MLDSETKRRIDTARDILVGKVPDPKSQVEQITIALIYKFMDDMDKDSVEFGGKPSFFTGEFKNYSWSKIFDPRLGGYDMLNLYSEAIDKMNINPKIPQLFRDIFKNAYLPYRDPETLKLFLKTINEFHYDHSEKLGDAFEYLLSVLSSQGDAGQFRTPRHIIDFMVNVIEPKKNETILDPACGTAGFLISSYKYILEHNTKKNRGDLLTPDDKKKLMQNFVGYDISPDMVRLSLVNMYLHNFTSPKIHEYDTLTSEDRWADTFDIIMANPPFMSPKGGINPHKRFSIKANRSEVLFVDYFAEHIHPISGRAAVIVPEGIIFQSANAYKSLRKILVDNFFLYAVASLPAGIFQPYSGVKTSILFLDKQLAKKSDSILFVKIENDGFDLGAQRRVIDKNDLPFALQTILQYKDSLYNGKKFEGNNGNVILVEKKKIAENGDYNLSIDRYRVNVNIRQSNFEMVRLSDVVDVFVDGDWIESKDQSEKGIRLIQTGNVGIGEYLERDDKARFISEGTFKRLNCTEVLEGDVLISRLPDPVGRACLVPKLNSKLITAVDCTIIRFDTNKMLPQLFVVFSKSENYFNEISQFLTGASRRRISRSNLAEIRIPLPPLSIQQEIVAKIESYQSIINGAKQVVENYKPQIDIDPIWEMVMLGDVIKLSSGKGLTQQNMKKGNYPVYGGNGINGYHNEYFIEEPIIVIGRVGAYCGIVHITTSKCWVSDNGLYVTEYLKNINQIYLAQILTQLELNQYAKVGGQPSISQSTIYELEIPFPSLKEQQQIVERIEQEQQLINANKELIKIYEQKIKDEINKLWKE